MSKKLSRILLVFLSIVSINLVAAQPVLAQTPQPWEGVCVGGPDNDVATVQGAQCLLANIFSVAIGVIGFAGFIMLIWGSIKYIRSGGDSGGIKSARDTMTFAVVGLVVSLTAFMLVNIIAEFTGVNLIKVFVIPDSNTVL
jgi:hypothetical protein